MAIYHHKSGEWGVCVSTLVTQVSFQLTTIRCSGYPVKVSVNLKYVLTTTLSYSLFHSSNTEEV